jgi:hypothetical protein
MSGRSKATARPNLAEGDGVGGETECRVLGTVRDDADAPAAELRVVAFTKSLRR